MGYMTFEQQTTQHLGFLQKAGLEVASLTINAPEFIRTRAPAEIGRGEYAYKTVSRTLDNGMVGLITWCRSEGGQINTYKTYGWPPSRNGKEGQNITDTSAQMAFQSTALRNTPLDADLERIRKFWEFSSQYGESDYLKKKGVGPHDIRFRENRYGKVGIVPARDIQGKLCGYQMLNSNGSKVFAKGMQLAGTFHQLTKLADGLPIGIAESYVTAATCFELIGMPLVTAFTSNNLRAVTTVLQERYPNSPFVMFADNDTHLSENKGIISAEQALEHVNNGGLVLAPHFENSPRNRDYSDWNDFVRKNGHASAFEQMLEGLMQARDDRIARFCTSTASCVFKGK